MQISDAERGHDYGYARVSTAAQDESGQVAQLRAAGCETVFREKITGTTADRPKLRKLMDALGPGDIVIIPAVDRLSRDTTDLLVIAREMQRRRGHPITGRAVSRYHVRLCRDRLCHSRRCRGARARRREGRQIRPQAEADRAPQREARERIAAGETQRSVARSYNVSQSTIARLTA